MKVRICPLCDSEMKKPTIVIRVILLYGVLRSWMFIIMHSREEWEKKIVLMLRKHDKERSLWET